MPKKSTPVLKMRKFFLESPICKLGVILGSHVRRLLIFRVTRMMITPPPPSFEADFPDNAKGANTERCVYGKTASRPFETLGFRRVPRLALKKLGLELCPRVCVMLTTV